MDNNSAFGSEAGWAAYPKLGLSWVASDQPRVRELLPDVINSFRLRGAYGASGQQPGVNTALRTLSPVAGPGGATVLTTGTFGNQTLKPELAEVTMKPTMESALAGGDAQRMRALLEALEALDDVQNVYTTAVVD